MSRWSTGKYRSRKSGTVYDYKSSWEAIYMDMLDSDPAVDSWEYESVWVMYHNGQKVKKYLPDFLVALRGGGRVLVEVKPEKLRDNPTNAAKRLAVQQKCREEGWVYYEWAQGQPGLP